MSWCKLIWNKGTLKIGQNVWGIFQNKLQICQGLKDKESGLQTRQMRGTEEIIKGCMLDLIGLGGGVGTDTL